MSMEMQHVTYRYGEGTAYEKTALKDVSLSIHDGEVVGIAGQTGSGKSTLIQHFDGLLAPSSGRVLYNGEDIHAKGYPLRSLRGKVGLVFQYPEYQLFEETILKDVMFGPKNQGLSEEDARRKAEDALRLSGIPKKDWELSPFELSGGQKRRAAVAGVLAMEPEVLILDEPAAGLDPEGRRALFAQILSLNRERGMTIVLVSHSMEDAAEYAGRLIVLDGGRVLFDGTPREVFSHAEELERAGLAAPEVTYLMRDLKARGLPVDDGAVTVEEAKEEILKLI